MPTMSTTGATVVRDAVSRAVTPTAPLSLLDGVPIRRPAAAPGTPLYSIRLGNAVQFRPAERGWHADCPACGQVNALDDLDLQTADAAGRTTGTDRTAEPVKPGHWRTPAVRADMVRRYIDKRQPMRKIAGALGCVYSTVNKVLTEEGVQKRGRGGSTGRRRAPSSPTRVSARTRRLRPDADPAPPSQSDRRSTRSGAGDGGAVS